MRGRATIYAVCLMVSLFISGSIILAPRLIEAGGFASKWGAATYLACGGLCHQDPGRSYYWDGVQFAVCHRCIGIYAGALLGLIIYPFTKYFREGSFPSLTMLVIFVAPVGIDLLLCTVGIWGGHPYIRTITGGMVAFIAGLYVVPGIEDFVKLIKGEK